MNLKHAPYLLAVVLVAVDLEDATRFAAAADAAEVTFSTAFESGSIGRIEKLSETTFRVHVLGQQDRFGESYLRH